MFYHSTFKLMFHLAICVLKEMENVGNSKEECVTSYVLNARLQTTETPSWETKKILYKQPLATDPKSLIPSRFFYFYLIHLIFCFQTLSASLFCYFPSQFKPDWNTLTIFTVCQGNFCSAFSVWPSCSRELGLDMDTHAQTTRCCVFVMVLVAHIFDWLDQTQRIMKK